jgi:hypothetical protein
LKGAFRRRRKKEMKKKYGAVLESVMGWGHRDSKLAPEKVRTQIVNSSSQSDDNRHLLAAAIAEIYKM